MPHPDENRKPYVGGLLARTDTGPPTQAVPESVQVQQGAILSAAEDADDVAQRILDKIVGLQPCDPKTANPKNPVLPLMVCLQNIQHQQRITHQKLLDILSLL